MPNHRAISVIIPTLNEAENLAGTIRCARKAEKTEAIVVDGGSTDATLSIAGKAANDVLSTTASRGGQMDIGAERARGEILLFLHADTCLPQGWDSMVREVIGAGNIGGAFNLSIYSSGKFSRIVSACANLRSRFLGITYGDQAIFVRRDVFKKVGGFKGLPIFEDIDLWCRLKKCGRLVLVKDSVSTSSRRWDRRGIFVTTLKNILFILCYYLGLSPHRLYKQYYGKRRT